MLYALASPPWDLWALAWLVPPLLLLPAASLPPRRAAVLGLVFGLSIAAFITPWAFQASLRYFEFHRVTAAAFVGAVWLVYSGIPYALLVGTYSLAARRCSDALHPILAAWAWVVVEVLRSTPVLGMPWGLLSHTQWGARDLIQIADLGGAYAVTFLVVFVSMSVGIALRPPAHSGKTAGSRAFALMPAIVLMVATLAYGRHALRTEPAAEPAARVAVVQGNVEDGFRWRRSFYERVLLRYVRLTDRIPEHSLDLVVWPENSVSFYLDREPTMLRPIRALADRTGAAFLVGAPRLAAPGLARNSAFLVDQRGGIRGTYDKRLLVPFAETPLIPSVAYAAEEPTYTGGDRNTPSLVTGDLEIGTLICFEILFPSLVRETVRQGANVLVNLSNDSWMDAGDGAAPRQHFAMAVLRSIEMRRALVRASSGGVSGFVGPTGDLGEIVPWGKSDTATDRVPLRREKTIYARFGDTWIWLLTLAVAIPLWRGRGQGGTA